MNLVEINNKFPTELDAIKHFEKVRWGKKIKCPYCKSERDNIKRTDDARLRCDCCNKSYSVTVNTHLHNTRLPLKTWLMAFAIVSDAKKGLSALQLDRNLGVHYETAFNMYHKIRTLMVMDNKTIDELDGIVEMDETYVGAKRPRLNNNGKRTFEKIEFKTEPEIASVPSFSIFTGISISTPRLKFVDLNFKDLPEAINKTELSIGNVKFLPVVLST